MSESSNGGDPEPTPMDRDCAFFVRDALFPLRRDWGSRLSQGQQKHHSEIHPALNALDRLRTELVEKRPTTMSYSNVFPRGVLLVAKSDALVDSSSSKTSSSSSSTSKSSLSSSSSTSKSSSRMEHNGQPDVDESDATVEVVPDVLTVRCLRCNDQKFRPRTTAKENAFVRTKTNPYTFETHHELVVCSDRVLRADYQQSSSRSSIGSERREDLPADSLRAVEETLARAIAKLTVRSDETQGDNDNDNAMGKLDPTAIETEIETATPRPRPRPTAIDSPSLSPNNCFEYARLELLAARASECLLERSADHRETRLGSAIAPAWLVSRLPHGLQRRFAERCAVASATKHTAFASRELSKRSGERLPERPRHCVRRAWEDLRRSEAEGG